MQSGASTDPIKPERRKHKRFKTAENAFASVRNGHGSVGNMRTQRSMIDHLIQYHTA